MKEPWELSFGIYHRCRISRASGKQLKARCMTMSVRNLYVLESIIAVWLFDEIGRAHV